jgi:hypothetical protein
MSSPCCNEASLDELFWDFAIQLLMRRDGVTEGEIRELLRKVKLARAEGLGTNERRSGPIVRVARECDRREIPLSGRTIKSRDSVKIPLRFI